MESAAVERVVLLGFMASGKSTVGALLARRLGWRHVDLDAEVEAEAGQTVADIFRLLGEPAFRSLEAEATERHLRAARVVLTPGGGWVTNPALLESLPPRTLVVWLRVSPEEALRRVRADRAGRERPLLSTPDPEGTVRRLLAARVPLYERADLTIDTDRRDAESVALELETIVRSRNATPLPS